jgi:outer membrane lipoprotein-sorting protein
VRTLPFEIVDVQRRSRLALLTALFVISIGEALSSRDLFDEIYERSQKQNAAVKTLAASFTESSTSPLLTKPLIEKGTVFVERPSRVVLRYRDPDTRIILIDGDKMTVSWPSAKVFRITDVGAAQRRVQKYFVDSSARALRGHFDIVAREAADVPNAYLVTMVPKRKQIQEGIVRLELWIDRTALTLSAMRMTFPSGDTKLMTFTDLEVNVAIDPAVFTVK